MACLGAVIGYGLVTLAAAMLESVMPALSQDKAWGATLGAIVLVSAGAWRMSGKLSPAQAAALQSEQTFLLDDDGFRLASATAETRMDWAHFLAARVEPDLIALKTREQTIVLLRPGFVADQAAWNEARRIVGERIAAG
jgi:hypothetical protein